jgi:hypothetical protein
MQKKIEPVFSQWGPAVNGLQCRIAAVDPKTDEQTATSDTVDGVEQFKNASDLTLLVELKNVSAEPLRLYGTRYNDNVSPPWPGKSVSNNFAPLVMDCLFTDADGTPFDRPTRNLHAMDAMHKGRGIRTETMEPGRSLYLVIRPTLWKHCLAFEIEDGQWQVAITYRGLTGDDVEESLKKAFPKRQTEEHWHGSSTSGVVTVNILPEPMSVVSDLIWGDELNGLVAAIDVTPHCEDHPHGNSITPFICLKNVSDREIPFWSETWRQDDTIAVRDPEGKESEPSHPWYSGWMTVVHWRLKPGQIARIPSIAMSIALDTEADAAEKPNPTGGSIIGPPGKYELQATIKLNDWQRGKDADRIPTADDWQGGLKTGWCSVNVRERVPTDDPPRFIGRFGLAGENGAVIRQATVLVRSPSAGAPIFDESLEGSSFDVNNCIEEPLMIDIRAAGFEETRFYEVAPNPAEAVVLKLKPAEPTTFRLLDRQGRPISDSQVRFFNRTKHDASAGPYPPYGLLGPVWATSNKDGWVALDTLQKFDPLDQKLGNNIYHFYVESPGLASFFIGPIEAGQTLGDLTVDELFEVSGEIQASDDELVVRQTLILG